MSTSENAPSAILDVCYVRNGDGQAYMPEKITKFFSKASADRVLSGSFRFGTLATYRGSEHAHLGTRMSDLEEGSQSFVFVGTGWVNQARIGNFEMRECYCEPGFPVYSHDATFNSLVFCAMEGGYNDRAHRDMFEGVNVGNGGNYDGNQDLTEWVELDFQKFIEELIALYRADAGNTATGTFLAGPVQYSKVTERVPLVDGVEFDPRAEAAVEALATFRKPTYFSPEKEYRIVIRPSAPKTSSIDLKPRFFESEVLKSCIVNSGSII